MISSHLPSIICEINPWYLKGFGVQLKELTDFFLDNGYKIYSYRTEGENKFPREVKVEVIVEDNYIFIHPTRLERFSALLKNQETV